VPMTPWMDMGFYGPGSPAGWGLAPQPPSAQPSPAATEENERLRKEVHNSTCDFQSKYIYSNKHHQFELLLNYLW
jgi:hypothetical protein